MLTKINLCSFLRGVLDIISLFRSLTLFVRKFSHRSASGSLITKLLKPAGSHCGVDGDADGWPDEDLPCSRDASFSIKETIYRNTFEIFSR